MCSSLCLPATEPLHSRPSARCHSPPPPDQRFRRTACRNWLTCIPVGRCGAAPPARTSFKRLRRRTRQMIEIAAHRAEPDRRRGQQAHELTKEETNPAIGLRVYVYSGGCSGFRYGMMLEDAPTAEDRILDVERHQGLRRRPEHRPPQGLADRLRRHPDGRRLHGQQPERGRGLRLRLQLPDRRRRAARRGAAPTDPADGR